MTSDDQKWIPVGKISGLFGVKGWMKIFSNTQPRDNILQYSPWYLKQDGQWQEFDLVNGQSHGKGVIAQLAGIDDRDKAAALMGSQVAIKRSQLPPPAEDEYYWSDLQGLMVVNLQGLELGKVTSLMETGANDVLIVHAKDEQTGKRRERLIPFVTGEIVQHVRLEQGVIEVDWDADF